MFSLRPATPEAFPDLAFSADLPEPTGDTPPELLGYGYNSSAWRIGIQVLKVTAQHGSLDTARSLLENMEAEYALLERFLGVYMPETRYSLGQDRRTHDLHVVTAQPFKKGTPLPEFLANPDNDTDPLQKFLAKSQDVYREERRMPDIACIENGFNVLVDSNILIREDEDDTPILVDTNFGKTQRSRSLGPLWNALIYTGAVFGQHSLDMRAGSRSLE